MWSGSKGANLSTKNRLVALATVVVVSLSACKASGEVDITLSHNSYCATGQSFVGETAEQDEHGQTGSLSITTNRYPLPSGNNCNGDRPPRPVNNGQAEYISTFTYQWAMDSPPMLCGSGSDVIPFNSTASQAHAVALGDCGSGHYQAEGHHYFKSSATGLVYRGETRTPSGWND